MSRLDKLDKVVVAHYDDFNAIGQYLTRVLGIEDEEDLPKYMVDPGNFPLREGLLFMPQDMSVHFEYSGGRLNCEVGLKTKNGKSYYKIFDFRVYFSGGGDPFIELGWVHDLTVDDPETVITEDGLPKSIFHQMVAIMHYIRLFKDDPDALPRETTVIPSKKKVYGKKVSKRFTVYRIKSRCVPRLEGEEDSDKGEETWTSVIGTILSIMQERQAKEKVQPASKASEAVCWVLELPKVSLLRGDGRDRR